MNIIFSPVLLSFLFYLFLLAHYSSFLSVSSVRHQSSLPSPRLFLPIPRHMHAAGTRALANTHCDNRKQEIKAAADISHSRLTHVIILLFQTHFHLRSHDPWLIVHKVRFLAKANLVSVLQQTTPGGR